MSRAKDKRIKKFNRKRIWPSIVGVFLISVILFGIVSAVLAIYTLDLIDKKLYDSYDLSNKIADYMISDDLSDVTQEELEQYIEITDTVSAVTVLDGSNNTVWSNNTYTPDINDALTYYSDTDVFESGFEIIIHYDSGSVFVKDDKEVRLSEDFSQYLAEQIKDVNIKEVLTKRNIPIMSIEIWQVIQHDGYNFFVLNDITVLNNDLYMVFITFVMMVFMIMIFMIYYISSLVSVARSQHKITKILYTDMITGGYNWLYFTKKGDRLLRRNRGKYNYAIVNLRMEKYRSFCTCFGVKEGEELLEKFYMVLKKNLRKKELMAHHDEADFGLLITYVNEEDLISRIDKLEFSLNSVMPSIKMYFRYGLCLADNNEREVDSLYNNASTALELLPEDSEEKIASYDIEMKKQQLWERKVEDEMDKALVTNQFKLYLQPKYSTKDEEIAGAEALVRWVHPADGLIPPNKFIPIFEKNGFILQLDDYMIEQVAIQQSKWIQEGRELFPISVNVSRAHFTREDLAEHICKIVDKYNVPHKFIELELTESAFFDDKYVLIDTVKQLRDYGFIVSMDDFGAGYSSLNSLKELSIDVLKIDADFFRGVDSVERGMLIVSEVIDLAKKLNMKIVAEGIESREQVDFLAAQECDLIQGYYFAKPMSIEEFEEKYN
ncbi:MAG: EAL domain-containing protein [Lachnospiraceae bacterium]|nr:EAL domain-containing protein [Lachnospiraceae bacterium]